MKIRHKLTLGILIVGLLGGVLGTAAIKLPNAPRQEEVFNHDCVNIVGRLAEDQPRLI